MQRTSAHYRDKADECRTMAEHARDGHARSMLINIADQYEELARRAEDRP